MPASPKSCTLLHRHAIQWIGLACLIGTMQAQERPASIVADGPRPIAKAVEKLEKQYGWVITYEDLHYSSSELVDITDQIPSNPEAPSRSRFLVPASRMFVVNYSVDSNTGTPADPADLIHKIVAAYDGGKDLSFTVLQSENEFHVVPQINPILDTLISLPDGEHTADQVLEAVCEAVTQVVHSQVVLGAAPINLLSRTQITQMTSNQSARSLISRILKATGRKLSWQLLYDAGIDWYVLNIHPVPMPAAPVKQ